MKERKKNLNQMTNTTTHTSTHRFNEGQSLVEFGLVIGLIVIVMLGSFEIFNLLQQKSDLEKVILQIARQAGEFGGVADGGDDGEKEIKAYVRRQLENLNYDNSYITPALDSLDFKVTELSGSTFSPVTGTTECQYGNFITVNMQVDWNTSIPLVLFFDGFTDAGTFDLTATARCWRAI